MAGVSLERAPYHTACGGVAQESADLFCRGPSKKRVQPCKPVSHTWLCSRNLYREAGSGSDLVSITWDTDCHAQNPGPSNTQGVAPWGPGAHLQPSSGWGSLVFRRASPGGCPASRPSRTQQVFHLPAPRRQPFESVHLRQRRGFHGQASTGTILGPEAVLRQAGPKRTGDRDVPSCLLPCPGGEEGGGCGGSTRGPQGGLWSVTRLSTAGIQ